MFIAPPGAHMLVDQQGPSPSPTGHDGATGAQAVKRAGGRVIVQDEPTSEFFGMPKSAIDAGQVDQILPWDRIAPALLALCGGGP